MASKYENGILATKNFDGPAIIVDDQLSLSYEELTKEVERIANQLPRRTLFFLLGSNDVSTIICYLAALKSGAVPLILGRTLSSEQLNRLIQVYDPQFIFSTGVVAGSQDVFDEEWRLGEYAFYRRTKAKASVLHNDLALLLATSGSTGSPKLVRLSLRNIIDNAESIVRYLDITPAERAITSLPFNYSYGLSVINSHLICGASLVLSNNTLMDKRFWQQISDHGATSFSGVPYTYDILMKLRFGQMQLPTIKTLTQAGGRLDPDKMQQINDICREKGIRFFPMYGQTEATARIAFLHPQYIHAKKGSIGKAIPGGELWLEDESRQRIFAADKVGELVYQGANVSLGYAECLSDLTLGDINQGVLHTGDLARMDSEGFFFIEGRLSRFLKIFGVRVSLDAVEKLAHEKGWTCTAHGVDDKLAIFAVNLQEASTQELKTELAKSLAIPSVAIKVYSIHELPRLNTGKVDYQCLSRMI